MDMNELFISYQTFQENPLMLSNFKSSLDEVALTGLGSVPDNFMAPRVVIPIRGYLNRQQYNGSALDPTSKTRRIEHLLEENNRLLDRIARLEDSIRDELKLWDKGFSENRWPTYEAAKRHLSRLKGSLQYPGFSDLGRARRKNDKWNP